MGEAPRRLGGVLHSIGLIVDAWLRGTSPHPGLEKRHLRIGEMYQPRGTDTGWPREGVELELRREPGGLGERQPRATRRKIALTRQSQTERSGADPFSIMLALIGYRWEKGDHAGRDRL